MRGLPDSAVYGTYRRLTHKKRKSAQTEVEMVFLVFDTISRYANRFNAKYSKVKK